MLIVVLLLLLVCYYWLVRFEVFTDSLVDSLLAYLVVICGLNFYHVL